MARTRRTAPVGPCKESPKIAAEIGDRWPAGSDGRWWSAWLGRKNAHNSGVPRDLGTPDPLDRTGAGFPEPSTQQRAFPGFPVPA